mmetsp:Transcript_3892/g.8720  ORF Transcript_3892/g.8720 Transcript_3892/m.8720 type:complete len:243 (+) Transcript_3892:4178-4906(+)
MIGRQVVLIDSTIGTKHVVPSYKDLVRVASGITSTADPNRLKDSTITQLFDNVFGIEIIWFEGIVGLKTTDVVRHGCVNAGTEDFQRIRELFAKRFHCNFRAFRPNKFLDLTNKLKVRTFQQLNTSRGQLILVLLQPILRAIFHKSSIMLHRKLISNPLGRTDVKTWTHAITNRVKAETKFLIRAPIDNTLLIQNLKNARAGFVNKIQHILIVREGDELPKDALTFILLLFEFENKLVELLL